MAAEIIVGAVVSEIVSELVKQLFAVPRKALRCRESAKNLAIMIQDAQTTIEEILHSGVEVTLHRQAQLRELAETLEECRKLTKKALKCGRWNMVLQLHYAQKMDDLRKKISILLKAISIHVLAEVHQHRVETEVRFDRIDRRFDGIDMRFDGIEERLDGVHELLISRRNRESGSLQEALRRPEATTEMATHGDLGNFYLGLELSKEKVKDMLFEVEDDQERLIGISGMSGSGKTTLAREIARDEEVLGHFEDRILFLNVSRSPDVEELRAIIWGFLTGYEDASGATLAVSIDQTRKLVILDDVWTKESLEQLVFNVPGTTMLVVSRFKLAGPRTYDVELLNEDEATSVLCLSAFRQNSIPPGFNTNLVKQIVEECKGLPLALKVIGASLKDRPEKYWQGVVKRLSRGEPADETHERRVFSQLKATLEILDPKTKECFLDLGAFPEDKKIPLDVIINMWVELHDDLDEETAFTILVDLSDKNLLTLVKDPRLGALYTGYYDIFVMQHDVLRDLAIRLSNSGKVNKRERLLMRKREATLPKEWERNNVEAYNARLVSIHTGEMTEMNWFDMEFPVAEVLILNFSSDNCVLPPFIAKMRRLKALMIINNGMAPAHLPNFASFTNLAELRSLWLEMVHVPELSNITFPMEKLHKLSLILCKINNTFDQALDMAKIFPNLSDLTVDHCDDLVELPSTICGITSLNSISITNCLRFTELPMNLSKLTALELLRLYACPDLKSLPEEICELPNLKYLDISQCVSLSSLPEEIGKLSRLEKIDMRECSIPSIPSSAISLTSLRHVICNNENLCMWEEIAKAIPGLFVESTET